MVRPQQDSILIKALKMASKISRVILVLLLLAIFLMPIYIIVTGTFCVIEGKEMVTTVFLAYIHDTNGGEPGIRTTSNSPLHAAGLKSGVLLFGYTRGESTFVGHIIGCRPDTFYVYEPFWSISKKQYYTKDESCDINTVKCRKYKDTSLNITNTVSSLYQCDTDVLDKLISSVQSQHSCKRNRKAFQTKNITKLQDLCINAKARVTKILRISADFAKGLLVKIPNLKLIYLHRDPRAIITSRRKNHKGPLQKSMVSALCKKMDHDSTILMYLARMYPDRVVFLPAERIAQDPVEVTKTLFEFLGFKFTPADLEQINNLSNLDKRHNRTKEFNFNPFKNDGYAASMAWRKTIQISDKMVIDEICQSVYRRLGYLNMSTVLHLRNITKLNIEYAKHNASI